MSTENQSLVLLALSDSIGRCVVRVSDSIDKISDSMRRLVVRMRSAVSGSIQTRRLVIDIYEDV